MAHLEFAASTLHTNWTPPEKHAIAAFTSQQITAALDAESARNQLMRNICPLFVVWHGSCADASPGISIWKISSRPAPSGFSRPPPK